MKINIKNLILITFCLYSLFFIVGSIFAPICAHYHQFDLSGKLTAMYMFSCHQDPSRSFWILNYPIALCCRCLGFYIGVAISSFVALVKIYKISFIKFALLLTIALADIICNYAFKLNTGNFIRFLAGIALGVSFITSICYVYKLKKERKWLSRN